MDIKLTAHTAKCDRNAYTSIDFKGYQLLFDPIKGCSIHCEKTSTSMLIVFGCTPIIDPSMSDLGAFCYWVEDLLSMGVKDDTLLRTMQKGVFDSSKMLLKESYDYWVCQGKPLYYKNETLSIDKEKIRNIIGKLEDLLNQ